MPAQGLFHQSWEVSLLAVTLSLKRESASKFDAHLICLSYFQKTAARILSPSSEPQPKTIPLDLEPFPFWFRGNNFLQV